MKFVCLKLYKPWSKLRLQLTLKQFQILIPHLTSSHLTQLQFSLFMQTICDCREKVSVRVPRGSLLFLMNFAMIFALKIPSSLAAPGVQGWWWCSWSTQLKLHQGVQSFIALIKIVWHTLSQKTGFSLITSNSCKRVLKCDIIKNYFCQIMRFFGVLWKNIIQKAFLPKISIPGQIVFCDISPVMLWWLHTGQWRHFIIIILVVWWDGATWVSFGWVCAAGLSDPLPS